MTDHDFCCGEGEQFIQQAEAVLWEHVSIDNDAAAEAAASMLTALLPAVLTYGNQRAAEALERVASIVHRVHVDLGPKADLWAVANGIERDAATLRTEAAS